MKGKLDDGTPVEIEKPGPIEQDGVWWEFVEYRKTSKDKQEHYFFDYKLMDNFTIYKYYNAESMNPVWIASEIPRASKEQLRAIGMKERDGKPALVKFDESYWSEFGKLYWCKDSAIYRFVLVPDVQKEIHNYTAKQSPMDGYRLLVPDEIIQECDEYKNHGDEWSPAGSITQTVKSQYPLVYRRKIQPAQPEEPRFSVEDERDIKKFIHDVTLYLQDNCMIGSKTFFDRAYELYCKYDVEGIHGKGRNEGKK
jgi:hypothetical protein